METPKRDYHHSMEWFKRAKGLIPSQTQTLAKGATQYVFGAAPLFVERGEGAYLWDVDQNRYIDFNMGIGPLILGYRHPAVDDAIRNQLEKGITFSLVHPLEVEVAEQLRRIVPNTERVRFSKTGADVTSAAVRLARAHTGRTHVAVCGYHGWHDWYIATTPRNGGIPEATRTLTRTFRYNDLPSLEAVLKDDTAAVILEPMLFEFPQGGFLEGVRKLCDARGALLIFDEMWTGFRLALGGAQQRFNVRADLAVFSKAIANGMPLSALTGRADVMERLDDDVFFYTTFGGEALSLAAAAANLRVLESERVCERLEERGATFHQALTEALQHWDLGFLRVQGASARGLLHIGPSAADPLLVKSLLAQELAERGVLWNGQWVLSQAHTPEILREATQAWFGALGELAGALKAGDLLSKLRGRPIQPAFRTTTGR